MAKNIIGAKVSMGPGCSPVRSLSHPHCTIATVMP
jgi:hypothetical protein